MAIPLLHSLLYYNSPKSIVNLLQLLVPLSRSPLPTTTELADFLFIRIPNPKTFDYNTVIRIHANSVNPFRALQLFADMKRENAPTDNYTYPFLLVACGLLRDCKNGFVVHAEVLKKGFVDNPFVVNGLLSFYCQQTGGIDCAVNVFDESKYRDSVSWNLMIRGFVECGQMVEAQKLFDEMPARDVFTYAILIDGYGKRCGDVYRARELFNRMPCWDLVCCNSLIDGYVRLGKMERARELFETMQERNVISWSIMVDGYVQHGDPNQALGLFQQMLCSNLRPDKISVVSVISACGQLGALEQGQWIHSYLKKKKIPMDIVVQTALVDMYMRCGSFGRAIEIFESMPKKNVISWNVMIVGLGTHGHGAKATELFRRMQREGTLMDDLTFIAILNACMHAGLVDEGIAIFETMQSTYGIEPKIEHYGCLVDLLGRAGRLQEAVNTITTLPVIPTPALWGSLLSSCKIYRSVTLAEQAVEQLSHLGADDCGVYVLLSNIYADEGMWEDVWRIRKMMKNKGLKKESGRSVIEIEGSVHEFFE